MKKEEAKWYGIVTYRALKWEYHYAIESLEADKPEYVSEAYRSIIWYDSKEERDKYLEEARDEKK